ncbi:hypothetical protein Bca4012_025935 [Brassica carinata]
MAGGRNRLRNRGRGTSYGSTFLGQTDPSAASTSAFDNVPDSQIPSVPYVRPQAVDHVAPYIPQYDDAAYFTYEEPRHDPQPHDPQPHDQQPPHQQPHPPHQAPAAPGLHPDLLLIPHLLIRIPGIGSVNDVPRARVEYAARTWQTLRSTFAVSDPTPEEQADLHRRAKQRSSELLDEINLNS